MQVYTNLTSGAPGTITGHIIGIDGNPIPITTGLFKTKKNNYVIQYDEHGNPDHAIVESSRGQFSKVSLEDWAWMKHMKWFTLQSAGTNWIPYLATSVRLIDGTRKVVPAHRMIMNSPEGNKGNIVDHYSGDSMDNRRSNLFYTSRSNNILNAKIRKDNSTGEKNIQWIPKWKRYRVTFMIQGKIYLWSSIKTLEEAIKIRDLVKDQLKGNYFKKGGK